MVLHLRPAKLCDTNRPSSIQFGRHMQNYRHSIKASHNSRRGTVVVLTAILLIPLFAMLAFCIDLGYMVRVKADLQNAADACALAGACELMTPQFNGITNRSAAAGASITVARSEAQK